MKKCLYIISFTVMLFIASFINPAFATSKITDVKNDATTTERIEQIKSRLEEIKAMDISKLTHDERRQLRKEIKSMRKEVREQGQHTGVFIAIGILLLLIFVAILTF